MESAARERQILNRTHTLSEVARVVLQQRQQRGRELLRRPSRTGAGLGGENEWSDGSGRWRGARTGGTA